jgi:hypothetical protein
MDGYASIDPRTLATRRQASRNFIAIGGFPAPYCIAMNEARERILVEAAQSRLLASGTRGTRSTRHPSVNEGQWFLPAWVIALDRWMTHPRFADAITK